MLDGGAWIELSSGGGATNPLTGAQIKALYESEVDTNPLTDVDVAKLGHIEITQALNLDEVILEGDRASKADAVVSNPSAAVARRFIDISVLHKVTTDLKASITPDIATRADILAGTVGKLLDAANTVGSSFVHAAAITPSKSLNEYKKTGYYANRDKNKAGNITLAYPHNGALGILKIISNPAITDKIYQEFADLNQAKIYSRTFDGSKWSNWHYHDLLTLNVADVANAADLDANNPNATQMGKILNLYGVKHLITKAMPPHPKADGEYKLKVAAGVATWVTV